MRGRKNEILSRLLKRHDQYTVELRMLANKIGHCIDCKDKKGRDECNRDCAFFSTPPSRVHTRVCRFLTLRDKCIPQLSRQITEVSNFI